MKKKRSREIRNIAKKNRKGLVLVHTGDGKGKTTAALGTAMRCAGNGMKVLMIQFIKGGWMCGELKAAKRLSPYLTIKPMGKGFTWEEKNQAKNIELARKAWDLGCRKMREGRHDMVIFDEINYAVDYGYLAPRQVVRALRERPAGVHVLLTGRNAPPEILEAADLVTEMKERKHHFKRGIAAQRGIEF